MKVLYFWWKNMPSKRASMHARLAELCDLTIVHVDSEQVTNMQAVLDQHDLHAYDRIVFDLRWTAFKHQPLTAAKVPNLVIYEEDVWQNYYPHARNRGKFKRFYRTLPSVRLLTSCWHAVGDLANVGVDAHFISKGYEPAYLWNDNSERDIHTGFIGSIHRTIDRDRAAMLQRAADECGTQVFRTEKGDDYRKGLNRLKVFVSADIGMREYMLKNFEAMACGAALLAYRQGCEEAMGFIDGENVLLYSDFDELKAKIEFANANPDKIADIGRRGQALVETEFTYQRIAERIFAAMQAPIATRKRRLADNLRALTFQRP